MKIINCLLILFFVCIYFGCSKIPIVDTPVTIAVPTNVDKETFDLVDNGVVYFAYDFGPYYFNIDSLQSHCSTEVVLSDSLLTNFNDFNCTYDYSAQDLSVADNFDLAISRNGNSFIIDSLSNNAIYCAIPYIFLIMTQQQ